LAVCFVSIQSKRDWIWALFVFGRRRPKFNSGMSYKRAATDTLNDRDAHRLAGSIFDRLYEAGRTFGV
jgi:hypothetical protein